MKQCVVCNKLYGFRLIWEIQKVFLRHSEVSLLWENCCSEKCYQTMLEKLLAGKWTIENHDDVATLNKGTP